MADVFIVPLNASHHREAFDCSRLGDESGDGEFINSILREYTGQDKTSAYVYADPSNPSTIIAYFIVSTTDYPLPEVGDLMMLEAIGVSNRYQDQKIGLALFRLVAEMAVEKSINSPNLVALGFEPYESAKPFYLRIQQIDGYDFQFEEDLWYVSIQNLKAVLLSVEE
jgi:hypothetical protein